MLWVSIIDCNADHEAEDEEDAEDDNEAEAEDEAAAEEADEEEWNLILLLFRFFKLYSWPSCWDIVCIYWPSKV